jgi:hypothetical protein
MDKPKDAAPQHIIRRVPEQCFNARVDEAYNSLLITHGNNIGDIVDESAKPLFPEHHLAPDACINRCNPYPKQRPIMILNLVGLFRRTLHEVGWPK